MREGTLVHAATGVHLVHGSNTNWVILSEGDAVTLIDCGYPGDRQQVLTHWPRRATPPRRLRRSCSPTHTTITSGPPITSPHLDAPV